MLCRLCLNPSEEYHMIFNEENDGSMSGVEALLEVFQLKVRLAYFQIFNHTVCFNFYR